MHATATDPAVAFWRHAEVISFVSAEHGTWALYERLKGLYLARFPMASSAEYEAAMRRIARLAGV